MPIAIVDEVDSILVDEARTPLIISGPTDDQTRDVPRGRRADGRSSAKDDYELDEKQRQVTLTEAGNEHMVGAAARPRACCEIGDLYDIENITIVHHVNQALKAHTAVPEGQGLHRQERQGRSSSTNSPAA